MSAWEFFKWGAATIGLIAIGVAVAFLLAAIIVSFWREMRRTKAQPPKLEDVERIEKAYRQMYLHAMPVLLRLTVQPNGEHTYHTINSLLSALDIAIMEARVNSQQAARQDRHEWNEIN